jgi:superfamily II DNA or RNA helicase
MEANTAAMLKQLDVTYDVPDIEIEAAIRNIEKKTEMELDEHQVEAVKEAVRNGLLVITGGPGTGKTTTINTIIKYFELEGMDIFTLSNVRKSTHTCELLLVHYKNKYRIPVFCISVYYMINVSCDCFGFQLNFSVSVCFYCIF